MAITRSWLITRPLLPLTAVQEADRPRANPTKASRPCRPPRCESSRASKSASLTSIQVSGFVDGPTQRLSPSPTYRTVPENGSPALDGRRPSHGSASAGVAAKAMKPVSPRVLIIIAPARLGRQARAKLGCPSATVCARPKSTEGETDRTHNGHSQDRSFVWAARQARVAQVLWLASQRYRRRPYRGSAVRSIRRSRSTDPPVIFPRKSGRG